MELSQFKTLFALDHCVKIYIPSTVDTDKPGEDIQREKTREALALLSDCFGGATAGEHLGGWMSGARLVTEKVVIVYAFCTSSDLEKHFAKVYNFAADMRDSMRQEAVSLELDGVLYLI